MHDCARPLRRIDDVGGGLIEDGVVVRLHPDPNLLLSSHRTAPPARSYAARLRLIRPGGTAHAIDSALECQATATTSAERTRCGHSRPETPVARSRQATRCRGFLNR